MEITHFKTKYDPTSVIYLPNINNEVPSPNRFQDGLGLRVAALISAACIALLPLFTTYAVVIGG